MSGSGTTDNDRGNSRWNYPDQLQVVLASRMLPAVSRVVSESGVQSCAGSNRPEFPRFGRTQRGYSVFPFSSAVVASVIAEIDGFASTKGGIKFTDKRHLPYEAFDALVARRRDEIDTALTKPHHR